MTILIFVVVLVALIVVHELGHFIAAKIAGMKVEEFGLGYPPRLFARKYGETEYSFNALPFGGFVRIEGEDREEEGKRGSKEGKEEDAAGEQESRKAKEGMAFTDKNRFAQACVLVAGILMNLLLAYALIVASLYLGAPRALSPEEAAVAPDAMLTVVEVLPGSPASDAGLEAGDAIRQAMSGEVVFAALDAEAFTAFVAEHGAEPVTLGIIREGKESLLSAKPAEGVVAADPGRAALGIAVVVVGTMREPFLGALADGAVLTYEITRQTAVGLAHFFASVFTLSADLSQVSGPVGIAGAVDSAAQMGFASLISITALISINLALINLVPVPALDGGRLLFVAIEAVVRRPIKRSIANAMNGLGFAFLVLLMLAVTAHDIFRIAA